MAQFLRKSECRVCSTSTLYILFIHIGEDSRNASSHNFQLQLAYLCHNSIWTCFSAATYTLCIKLRRYIIQRMHIYSVKIMTRFCNLIYQSSWGQMVFTSQTLSQYSCGRGWHVTLTLRGQAREELVGKTKQSPASSVTDQSVTIGL